MVTRRLIYQYAYIRTFTEEEENNKKEKKG